MGRPSFSGPFALPACKSAAQPPNHADQPPRRWRGDGGGARGAGGGGRRRRRTHTRFVSRMCSRRATARPWKEAYLFVQRYGVLSPILDQGPWNVTMERTGRLETGDKVPRPCIWPKLLFVALPTLCRYLLLPNEESVLQSCGRGTSTSYVPPDIRTGPCLSHPIPWDIDKLSRIVGLSRRYHCIYRA